MHCIDQIETGEKRVSGGAVLYKYPAPRLCVAVGPRPGRGRGGAHEADLGPCLGVHRTVQPQLGIGRNPATTHP